MTVSFLKISVSFFKIRIYNGCPVFGSSVLLK
nr:MAG TPA: hypothetical protein [Caudoviricetes sp.]